MGTIERVVCLDAGYAPAPIPDELLSLETSSGPELPPERMLDMISADHHALIARALDTAVRTGVSSCRMQRSQQSLTRPGQETFLRAFNLLNTHDVMILLVGEFGDTWTAQPFTPSEELQPRLLVHRTDSTGRYVHVDPNVTAILGWDPDELMGEPGLRFLHPDDRDTVASAWLQALAGGKPCQRRARLKTLDGGWRWFELIHQLDPDSPEGIIRIEAIDIADEIEALEHATAEASRFETLTQSLPVGIVQFDADRTITFANQWVADKMGVSTDRVTKELLAALVHPEDRSQIGRWVTAALDGHTVPLESRLRPVDAGEYRHFRIRAKSVPTADSSRSIICSIEDYTESVVLHERLRNEASCDHLTGLPNRSELTRRLRVLFDSHTAFAVVFFDLDSFKLVNDGLGHDAGDQLLVAIARRLEAALGPRETVARVGGDEFVVVSQIGETRDAVLDLVDTMMGSLHTPLAIGGVPVTVSVSVGIAFCDGSEGSPDVVISNADLAMYDAKRSGGSRWAIYSDEMRADMEQRFDLHRSMQSAITNGEFAMHLQPIFDMSTGAVIGAEGLIRWHHPTRGRIPPSYFIDYVAESDLMIPLGWWILDESCRIAARIVAATSPAFRVSVNITGRQLTEPGFADKLFETIARHGLAPANLALEITETVLISDGPLVSETLEAIGNSGCYISLDDFGTGYSSLNHLRDIPVDAIKIDQSYTRQIDTDPATLTIVKTIGQLAEALGLRIVLEGIETDSQRRTLLDLGFKVGQGFLLGRPCDEEHFLATYGPLVRASDDGEDFWEREPAIDQVGARTRVG